NPEVAEFVHDHCTRFWDTGVPALQGGYEYGWIACENLYCEEEGRLQWDGVKQFSPRDGFLLTQNNKPVGVRVKPILQTSMGGGPVTGKNTVDLWMATCDVPAKGLWYAHNPRYSQFYG